MRLSLLMLSALLLLVAGCAGNRPDSAEVAPSRLAGLSDANSGWSVPPGQKTVTDPADAGATAAQPPVDEAAIAEAERRERAEAARKAREELRAGRGEPADAVARQQPARPAAQPPVKPIVPAFPVRAMEERVLALRTVHFAFDTSELTPEAKAQLDENARWLRANPEVMVRVEGHADERGTPEYNLALGERRALRVRAYLIDQGVPADNLLTISFGEEVPFDSGQGEAAWSLNRRAEFSRGEDRQVSGNAGRTPSG